MIHTPPTIGIDISKNILDCAALPSKKYHAFPNTPEGIQRCIAWIKSFGQIYRIVIEPTGGYERLLLYALQEEALPVARVNAYLIKRFRQSCNDQAKTDRQDALLLAKFGVVAMPRLTAKRSEGLRQLQALVKRRAQLTKYLAAEQKHLKELSHAPEDAVIHADITATIAGLKAQITRLAAHIKAAIMTDESLKERYELLTAHKGMGMVAAATLLAVMPQLGTFTRREVARFVGVAPMNHESGLYQGKRHIRGGRADVRHVLYMAAMVAARFHEQVKPWYEQLKAKGKATKVAQVAVMRKFIILINSQMAQLIAQKNNQLKICN